MPVDQFVVAGIIFSAVNVTYCYFHPQTTGILYQLIGLYQKRLF